MGQNSITHRSLTDPSVWGGSGPGVVYPHEEERQKEKKIFCWVFSGHRESLDYFVDHIHSDIKLICWGAWLTLQVMMQYWMTDSRKELPTKSGSWGGVISDFTLRRKIWNQSQHLAFNRSVFHFLIATAADWTVMNPAFQQPHVELLYPVAFSYNGLSMLSSFCGQHKFGQRAVQSVLFLASPLEVTGPFKWVFPFPS